MRHSMLVCFALLPNLAIAQDALQVQPDPKNHVAASLAGDWQRDPELAKRLGTAKAPAAFSLREDHKVLASAPAAIVEHLRGRRLYTAGIIATKGKEQVFVLTESSGSPELFVYSASSPDPVRGGEHLRVTLVPGASPASDILFVADAAAGRPFTPFSRVAPQRPANLEPEAAVTEMARVLEAGNFVEFFTTWCLPEDVAKMTGDGKSIEDVAKKFGEKKGKKALASLLAAAKVKPVRNEAGDEVVFEGEGIEMPVRLKRVDGRWYLCNR